MKKLLIILFLNIIVHVCAQTPSILPPTTLPLNPVDLLSCLPEPPKETEGEWQLTQSRAFNQYEDQWLVSHAIRSYVFVPNPDVSKQTTAPKPQIVFIQLDDTGYSPSANASFLALTKPDAPKLRILDEKYPYITNKSGENVMTVVWVGMRYIVTIRLSSGDSPGFEKWFKLLALDKLLAASATPIAQVPRPYEQIHIDELNPANNITNKGYYITVAEDTLLQNAKLEKAQELHNHTSSSTH